MSCSNAGSRPDVSSFVSSARTNTWRAADAQTALSYRPDPDGLSFGNYQMTDTSSFTIDDAAALLKDAVCTKGVSKCVPSAAAVEWVESVRAALQGGLCEGFSLLSMTSYRSSNSTPAFVLQKSKETERTLSRLFATQFMPEVRTAARSWRERKLKEIVSELARALSTKTELYTIGLYSSSGGHAIVPYAINELSPGMFVISVYDSNWPGRDRFLEIDTNNDTWRFSYKAEDQQADTHAWSGKSGSMDITPYSVRTGKFSSPFEANKKASTLTLTVSATDTSWSVTQAGKILASALTASNNDEVRGAFGVRTLVLEVQPGKVSVKLPSAARVSVTSSSSIVSVQAAKSDVNVEFNLSTELTATVNGKASLSIVAAQSRVTLSSFNTAMVGASKTGEITVRKVDKDGSKHAVSLPASLLRRDATEVADNMNLSNPTPIKLPSQTLIENLNAQSKPSSKPLTTQPSDAASTTPHTPLPPVKPTQDCRTINPTAGVDSDKDGLSDALERCVRTDPQSRDTDSDGLTDADEVLACLYPKPGPGRCSNPTKPDSDSDGLRDPEELRLGTNPNAADTDQDSIPDGDELNRGLNPLDRDSSLPMGNDGVPDPT